MTYLQDADDLMKRFLIKRWGCGHLTHTSTSHDTFAFCKSPHSSKHMNTLHHHMWWWSSYTYDSSHHTFANSHHHICEFADSHHHICIWAFAYSHPHICIWKHVWILDITTYTYECFTSHISMWHVTHMDSSRHTHGCSPWLIIPDLVNVF